MTIIEDTRQQMGKHIQKNACIEIAGHKIVRNSLPVGDYTSVGSRIYIDTKKDMYEIANNLCSTTREHERFRRECVKAQEMGVKLIFLIENDGEWIGNNHNIWNPPVNSIADIYKWKNKRLFIFKNGQQRYPRAVKGKTLAKVMRTMEIKYDIEFMFCRPEEAGNVIIDILSNNEGITEMYYRYRFKIKAEDVKPLKSMEDINMPWWYSGKAVDGSYSIIVAYLPIREDLFEYWEDAYDIQKYEMDKIIYTDKFPKPEWIKGGD